MSCRFIEGDCFVTLTFIKYPIIQHVPRNDEKVQAHSTLHNILFITSLLCNRHVPRNDEKVQAHSTLHNTLFITSLLCNSMFLAMTRKSKPIVLCTIHFSLPHHCATGTFLAMTIQYTLNIFFHTHSSLPHPFTTA
jgi:hypothetical protein